MLVGIIITVIYGIAFEIVSMYSTKNGTGIMAIASIPIGFIVAFKMGAYYFYFLPIAAAVLLEGCIGWKKYKRKGE